ncbi:MAG: tRNA (N6-threonylcarbamoyladenosine(37)-N6)-methyltransferase TrmO [Gammaproteobacteria bacterium]
MINLKPVGYVKTNVQDQQVAKCRADIISEIIIESEWSESLLNIEQYSHIFVLFWLHKTESETVEQQIFPRGDKNLPLTGIFATRSRNRPNPIGMAVVELLKRKGNSLTVKRLDAFDGTPILDIKPYDDYDVFENVDVPAWWAKRCRK